MWYSVGYTRPEAASCVQLGTMSSTVWRFEVACTEGSYGACPACMGLQQACVMHADAVTETIHSVRCRLSPYGILLCPALLLAMQPAGGLHRPRPVILKMATKEGHNAPNGFPTMDRSFLPERTACILWVHIIQKMYWGFGSCKAPS